MVSESEKILQKKKVGRTSKGHKNQPDKAPNGQRENNLSNKRKKKKNRVLDLAPKQKINMLKSIPTDINKSLNQQRRGGQGTTFPYRTPIRKYGRHDRNRKFPPETTVTIAAGNAHKCMLNMGGGKV